MSAKHQGRIPALKRHLSLSFHLMEVGVIALVMFAAGPAAAVFNIPTRLGHPDRRELLTSATSPDGKWVVEDYVEFYPEDTARHIALHHPQKTPATSDQFLPYISDAAQFKWLDNSTLLIAAPEGSRLDTSLQEYKSIRLQYGFFPDDPDIPRISGSQHVFKKTLEFQYEFGRGRKNNREGVDCYLSLAAQDGEYLNGFTLEFWLTKETSRRDEVNAPQYMYEILRRSDGTAIDPLTSHTSIKVQGLPSPYWGKLNRNDLTSFIRKIKHGGLRIKYGFWLDNTEVIFATAVPRDVSAVDDFEHCIKQHHIFTSQEPDRGI